MHEIVDIRFSKKVLGFMSRQALFYIFKITGGTNIEMMEEI